MSKKDLKKIMIEQDKNNKHLAKWLGCSYNSIANRLNGSVHWTYEEVYILCQHLNITPEEATKVFRNF